MLDCAFSYIAFGSNETLKQAQTESINDIF